MLQGIVGSQTFALYTVGPDEVRRVAGDCRSHTFGLYTVGPDEVRPVGCDTTFPVTVGPKMAIPVMISRRRA